MKLIKCKLSTKSAPDRKSVVRQIAFDSWTCNRFKFLHTGQIHLFSIIFKLLTAASCIVLFIKSFHRTKHQNLPKYFQFANKELSQAQILKVYSELPITIQLAEKLGVYLRLILSNLVCVFFRWLRSSRNFCFLVSMYLRGDVTERCKCFNEKKTVIYISMI